MRSTKKGWIKYGCEEEKRKETRTQAETCCWWSRAKGGGPQDPRAKMWNKRSEVRYGSCHRTRRNGTASKICQWHSAKVDQSGFGWGRKRVSLTALDTG